MTFPNGLEAVCSRDDTRGRVALLLPCSLALLSLAQSSLTLFCAMTFVNTLNHHTVTVRHARLWTFLFGPLYFASHGVWSHAVISLVVAVFTAGVSWLVYSFFAPSILRNAYLTRGWQLNG